MTIDDPNYILAHLCAFCDFHKRRELPLFIWNSWIHKGKWKNLRNQGCMGLIYQPTAVKDSWTLIVLYKEAGFDESKVHCLKSLKHMAHAD